MADNRNRIKTGRARQALTNYASKQQTLPDPLQRQKGPSAPTQNKPGAYSLPQDKNLTPQRAVGTQEDVQKAIDTMRGARTLSTPAPIVQGSVAPMADQSGNIEAGTAALSGATTAWTNLANARMMALSKAASKDPSNFKLTTIPSGPAARRFMQRMGSGLDATPEQAKRMATIMARRRGWNGQEIQDMYKIIEGTNSVPGESSWRIDANNPTSTAYGIPQALHPPDSQFWDTHAKPQLRWLLNYLGPNGHIYPGGDQGVEAAWAYKQANGTY